LHGERAALRDYAMPEHPVGRGEPFALGDATFPEPYVYVNPYGVADPDGERPPLPAGGFWAEGWLGAVHHARPSDRVEAALEAFLVGAFEDPEWVVLPPG
jgi:hypothetical protein